MNSSVQQSIRGSIFAGAALILSVFHSQADAVTNSGIAIVDTSQQRLDQFAQ
ncbi:MAG: hypothetical protein ABJH63_07665 [Rhizobiaceae bacterium]